MAGVDPQVVESEANDATPKYAELCKTRELSGRLGSSTSGSISRKVVPNISNARLDPTTLCKKRNKSAPAESKATEQELNQQRLCKDTAASRELDDDTGDEAPAHKEL